MFPPPAAASSSIPPIIIEPSAPPAGPDFRRSRGLEQFLFEIRDLVGLSILDAGGANQENVAFLTGLGHRVYTENLLRSLEESFGPEPAEQTNAGRIEYFLRSNFDYPADTFDGVLLWDGLQFMGPALLSATVERLVEIMKPRAALLAFFSANDRLTQVPAHSFRIVDDKSVQVAQRDMRPTGQVFNNRNLERIFGRFESVKFFLTRENLREVIAKR